MIARRSALACIALAVCAMLAGCGGERPLPQAQLRIATGNTGGVYIEYGEGLARAVNRHLPRLDASVRRTDGSRENLELLADKRVEVAFSLADSAEAFRRKDELRALASLYDNYVQLIVRADSDVHSVADLAGLDVSLGAPGSGTALIANRVLRLTSWNGAARPRPLQLDLEGSTEALRRGRIDAFFWSGGLPTPAIAELSRAVPIRLVDLRGVAAKLTASYGDLYHGSRIPRKVYGSDDVVRTVSVANLLVVRRDLDTTTAYRLTRLLFQQRAELIADGHPEAARLSYPTALGTFPLRLHPGAASWYRENS